MEIIKDLLKIKKCAVIAIDGRCGAGKTTLAEKIRKEVGCEVIHMDDFFLRKEQRSPQRLERPGENVDHERFLAEVIIPLNKGESFSYRPFVCSRMDFGESIYIKNDGLVVVEGSYSCHRSLIDFYDLKIFCDIDKNEQMKRLEKREGKEKLKAFTEKWIPLEEAYFNTFKIKEKCDLIFEAGN